jgi:hypothetical protein
MSTQRYISTSFWDDEWIRKNDPSERYVYLYLLTNPLTNIAVIYKTTIDRMSFDTGYEPKVIETILKRFADDGKAFFHKGYVIIPSWPKHQKAEQRAKIKSGIESIIKELPADIINFLKQIGYKYHMDTISIPYKYPMDRVSIPYGYLPNYSDLDPDLDSDPDLEYDSDSKNCARSLSVLSDILEDSQPAAVTHSPATTRLTWLIAAWNDKGLPYYTFLPVNFHRMSEALAVMQTYSDQQIVKAMDNYLVIKSEPDRYDCFPKMPTFETFICTGMKHYGDEAEPLKNKLKPGVPEKRRETPDERVERITRELEEEKLKQHREAIEEQERKKQRRAG